MITLTHIFYPPRFMRRVRRQAIIEDCPPPPTEPMNEWEFGPYCWKAVVETNDKLFMGYSKDISIATDTEIACDRYKTKGTTCSEAKLIIKGGECDEVILMKNKRSNIITRLK